MFTKVCHCCHQAPSLLGRARGWPYPPPAASSIFTLRGGARPRGYPLFMSFRALLPTTWVCFRAESAWAGRRGGDGGERPGRAGAAERSGAERSDSGRHPRGVQAPVLPRRGRLGTAVTAARGPEGDFGVGVVVSGGALAGDTRNAVGSFPRALHRRRGPGRGWEPFPSAPAALGSEDGFPPTLPCISLVICKEG